MLRWPTAVSAPMVLPRTESDFSPRYAGLRTSHVTQPFLLDRLMKEISGRDILILVKREEADVLTPFSILVASEIRQ